MRRFLRNTLCTAAMILFCHGVFGQDPPAELLLGFVGDIMAHNVNYHMADYSRIYDGVSGILRSDDLTFANLEFPVDPALPQMTYPRFNNHPAYVRAAVEAGIEERRPGGLGLYLVQRMVDDLDYDYDPGSRQMRVSVSKRLES